MKPVAWRYENKNVKGNWYITWTEPPDGFNKRALYEAPPDEAAWRELDDERVAYINRVGDILGQVGEDSLEDTATRVMQQLAHREKQIVMLRDGLKRADDLLRTSYDHVSPLIQEALAATADLSGYILCEREPVGYIFQHEDTGRTMCVEAQQVEWNFEKNNPRLFKVGPLYAPKGLNHGN